MKINDILLEPILTEKATNLAKEKKIYMFKINTKATKNQVKKALEKIFSVKVDKVRIQIRKGKIKRTGKRLIPKKTTNKKIAYIKLSKGEIDIFPTN